MYKFSSLVLAFAASLVFAPMGHAARVGDQAPEFTGTASSGKSVTLSHLRGKYVVLEWHNRDCPYTKKQYESGNMQSLQKEWRAKGVVWLTMISSAKGEQGYVNAEEENAYVKLVGADPTAVILDPSGSIGHLFDAKTTPQIFIIDPGGKLIYNGAIDDHPTTDVADVKVSKNYLSAALTEAMSGHAVEKPYTRPYGCSVKYAQ